MVAQICRSDFTLLNDRFCAWGPRSTPSSFAVVAENHLRLRRGILDRSSTRKRHPRRKGKKERARQPRLRERPTAREREREREREGGGKLSAICIFDRTNSEAWSCVVAGRAVVTRAWWLTPSNTN
ncbi:hypothetical protein O6H91_10G040700 [Diphasiastrum complanatum]|uniref:Uncharacterized protein n=1 Tax=Diphasiastrum complanatum TaxID=34168 RepID=A0ACC2CGA1_DIPCM|nr:hypothetical protein O6H91_10G040700 [Diphasiastrum complanatum]